MSKSKRKKVRVSNPKKINIFFIHNDTPKEKSTISEPSKKNIRFTHILLLVILIYIVSRDSGILKAIKANWETLEPVSSYINWLFGLLLFIFISKSKW